MAQVACPHCSQSTALMEPADLDRLGLTTNPRADAIKRGELRPWMTVRKGLHNVFLKEDVDEYVTQRRLTRWSKLLDRLTPAEKAELRDAIDDLQ